MLTLVLSVCLFMSVTDLHTEPLLEVLSDLKMMTTDGSRERSGYRSRNVSRYNNHGDFLLYLRDLVVLIHHLFFTATDKQQSDSGRNELAVIPALRN